MNFKKFINTVIEWKWAIILLLICIAGIPLTTIYGIQSVHWGNDFWPNALSEFLGMFVELIFGAIFTFVVIDKYVQYHKNKQWRKIKNITYKNLYFTLSNILLKLNWAFPKEMRVGTYVLSEDMETLNDYLPKADFDVFVQELSKNIDILVEQKHAVNHASSSNEDVSASFADEHIHEALAKFKTHTKADMNSISNLVIPKLLNLSDDPVMLDGVIELEELFTSLMAKIDNPHRKHKNEDNGSYDVKYIWFLKLKDILGRMKSVADFIQNDVDIN